jgi:integrase/recombinase XerC
MNNNLTIFIEVISMMNTALTISYPSAFSNSLFYRFIEYTSVKDTTIKGYTVCLRHFMSWIADQGISNPLRSDIKTYKEYLDARDFTAGTRAQYFRAVKHFFKWTASEGLYPNVADNIKGAKVKQDNTKKDPLQEADVIRVLNSINRDSEAGKRDYAMFMLAITGGLRIIELQRANIEDIKIIAGEHVLFIQGKGRDEKDEYKKLIPEVFIAIEQYITARPAAKKTDALFTGTSNRAKGQRMTEPSISRIIKSILITAGYDSDRLTAHSLRHTSVTLLLKAGATLQEAQHHARHSDPATTGIYAHNIKREKDRSEQRIFNQIFKPDAADQRVQVLQIFDAIPPARHQEALELLKAFAM